MNNSLYVSRAALLLGAVVLIVPLLAACVAVPAEGVTPPTAAPVATTAPVEAAAAACDLAPVAQPAMPEEIPGYAQQDPNTGLHMTGNPQLIDLASYRLNVTGLVDHPLSVTYDELRCMPKVVREARLECPGFFVDSATWGGVPFSHILELAGVQKEAQYVAMLSADGYWAVVPIGDALAKESFLAYEQTGRPLPVLHGFPVRAVFPLLPGGKWVKWLTEIQLLKDAPALGPAPLIAQPTAATN